jgi:hypothetical protein
MPNMTAADFKDYVYPGLDLVLKLLIGIGIAYLLHRRANADKIKERLIETYLQFLDSHIKVARFQLAECERCFYQVLKQRLELLGVPSESKATIAAILMEEEARVAQKLTSEAELELSRFTAFTYRFCLLLGAHLYFRRLGDQEKQFMRYVLESGQATKLTEEIFASDDFGKAVADFVKRIGERPIKEQLAVLSEAFTRCSGAKQEELSLTLANPYSTGLAKEIDRV